LINLKPTSYRVLRDYLQDILLKYTCHICLYKCIPSYPFIVFTIVTLPFKSTTTDIISDTTNLRLLRWGFSAGYESLQPLYADGEFADQRLKLLLRLQTLRLQRWLKIHQVHSKVKCCLFCFLNNEVIQLQSVHLSSVPWFTSNCQYCASNWLFPNIHESTVNDKWPFDLAQCLV